MKWNYPVHKEEGGKVNLWKGREVGRAERRWRETEGVEEWGRWEGNECLGREEVEEGGDQCISLSYCFL